MRLVIKYRIAITIISLISLVLLLEVGWVKYTSVMKSGHDRLRLMTVMDTIRCDSVLKYRLEYLRVNGFNNIEKDETGNPLQRD